MQRYADLVQPDGTSSKTVISVIINKSGFSNPVVEGVWAQEYTNTSFLLVPGVSVLWTKEQLEIASNRCQPWGCVEA